MKRVATVYINADGLFVVKLPDGTETIPLTHDNLGVFFELGDFDKTTGMRIEAR